MARLSISPKPRPLRQGCHSVPLGYQGSPVMAQSSNGMHGNAFSQTPALAISDYRCVSKRMGSTSREAQDRRCLISSRALTLHQCQRAKSSCLACQTFQAHLQGRCVSVLYKTDRVKHAPLPYARKSSSFCIAYSVHLEASYFPGSRNELVDHLSRSSTTMSSPFTWTS